MDTQLALSLFPGIGLLDMAFEEAGFCVVRGPDLLWGGDVKTFHPPPGRFDGVIGGPPCQAFSRLRHIVEHNGYKLSENLIPEYERCVSEARPAWFLMENVPDAPEPRVDGYSVKSFLFNNRWTGQEQNRLRRFCFGIRGRDAIDLRHYLEYAPLECPSFAPAVLAKGGYRSTPVRMEPNGKVKSTAIRAAGYVSRRTVAEGLRLQGLLPDFLDHAPFTVAGKQQVIGNGAPLPMGRAIANAVLRALEC